MVRIRGQYESQSHYSSWPGIRLSDEGKGSITDYLARRYSATLVVRYNGGPQAAHNVCLSDGRHHTFAQLGSASFTGAHTHLSRFMLVEPLALFREVDKFSVAAGISPAEVMRRITFDPRCLVIHPMHQVLNQVKEAFRGVGKHGSCGLGIGECRRFQVEGKPTLTIGDLKSLRAITEKMAAIAEIAKKELESYKSPAVAEGVGYYEKLLFYIEKSFFDIAKNYRLLEDEELQLRLRNRVTIFEGAQGVLLDETHGFAPYNTWTNTTTENARTLIGNVVPITSVGVLRTYSTRHGPGPFVSENNMASTDKFNVTGEFQGKFRCGYFDMVAARYALRHSGGIDAIALTCLDEVKDYIQVVENYLTTEGVYSEIDGLDTIDLMCAAPLLTTYPANVAVTAFQKLLDKPIVYCSYGPTERDKITVGESSAKGIYDRRDSRSHAY